MTSFGLMRASVAASSAGRAFRHHEFGGRNIDPGEPDAVAAGRGAGARDRQQIIVGAGIEQRVFGQRARRHQPHHAAARPRSCCRGRARRPDPRSARTPRRDGRRRSGDADSPRSAPPARRTSGYPCPDACRAWSARCRASWRRSRHPRRTARRNRPSGRTAAARDGPALISRYCSIIGVTRAFASAAARLGGRDGWNGDGLLDRHRRRNLQNFAVRSYCFAVGHARRFSTPATGMQPEHGRKPSIDLPRSPLLQLAIKSSGNA